MKNFLKSINNIWNLYRTINSLYHLVTASGYPLMLSVTLFLFLLNLVKFSDLTTPKLGSVIDLIVISIMLTLFIVTFIIWLINVLIESIYGDHTKFVVKGLKIGFLLFISSEIMLFFAVFWGWFHINLLNEFIYTESHSSNYLEKINWYPLPGIGTIILGTSSALLTESHYTFNWIFFRLYKIKNIFKYFQNKYINTSYRLIRMTSGFGFLFLILQSIEYNMLGYSWRGHVYASLFYMITSLHGSHVLIGLIFLVVCYFRIAFNIINQKLISTQLLEKLNSKFIIFFLFKFEAAILIYKIQWKQFWEKIELNEIRNLFLEVSSWYWHFVDIIWLFVFLYVYFWLTGYQILILPIEL